MKPQSNAVQDVFNSKEFGEWTNRKRLEARRNRNFDRAVLIVARLNFEGVIVNDVPMDFYDFIHENAVKVVLDMLERFQLDSPEGEIVDIFGTQQPDAPGV